MIITVYKVVHVRFEESMVSCSIEEMDGYMLEYRIGQETRAREETLGVMCFCELDAAKRWMVLAKSERVLRCETRFKPRRLGRMANISPSEIMWFNEENANHIKRLHRRGDGPLSKGEDAPPGTFVVRALTPVEIVEGK